MLSTNFISTQANPQNFSVAQLRAKVKGQVITPQDADYDPVRVGLSREAVRRPALIVRPIDATDISHAVSLARETGMELAVRSGGHSLAGHGTSDGLVIDLSLMKGLEINVQERTAWAEAGLTAGEYTEAAAKVGLATGFGDSATVGIGGLTTGGGIGYLVRKYGLTIDNLLAARVVTADGEIRYADADHHPDLFWAIRGGGGNFGVVSHFKFRLHPVDTIVGGMLVLPATPELIAAVAAQAEAAPEELSAIVNILPAPPLPFVPADYHGKIVMMVTLVYTGNIEAGLRAVAPFRQLATPIVDMLGPMPYAQIYLPEDPNMRAVTALRSKFIDNLDEHTAQTMLDQIHASTAMMSIAQFRVLGGAMSRVPVEATAFAHRLGRIMVTYLGFYADPADAAVHNAWATNAVSALAQGEGAVYVNFMSNEGQARVRNAYPTATWERLSVIKAKYDPTNLFHLNQNVTPKAR